MDRWKYTEDCRVLNPNSDLVRSKFKKLIFNAPMRIKLLYWPSKILPHEGYSSEHILDVRLDHVLDKFYTRIQVARGYAGLKSAEVRATAETWINEFLTQTRIGKELRLSDRVRFFDEYVGEILDEHGNLRNNYRTTSILIENAPGLGALGIDPNPDPNPVRPVNNPNKATMFEVSTTRTVPNWDATFADAESAGNHVSEDTRAQILDRVSAYGVYPEGHVFTASELVTDLHETVIDMQDTAHGLMSAPVPACYIQAAPARRSLFIARNQ